MSPEENDGFRVIDRRSSSEAKDGPGFVMKETNEVAAAAEIDTHRGSRRLSMRR